MEEQSPLGLFRPGDRVAMIGDSITNDGRWWTRARELLLLRVPGADLDFRNLGIPGDTVAGVLARYDRDIAPVRASVAVVMLGMNDVPRHTYGDPQPSPEVLRQRRVALAGYSTGLWRLVERLRNDAMRVVVCSPTPYEQEAELAAPNLLGVDGALAECTVMAAEVARQSEVTFIDFHGPMRGFNEALRKADPAASLIGPDRVHPGDAGHAVMARLFLKGVFQGRPRAGSTMVDADANIVVGPGVSSSAYAEDLIRWQHLGGLPPVPDLPEAERFVPGVPERMVLRALLPDGRWTLRIDGKDVHTADEMLWAAGLDLGTVDNPLLEQAQAIRASVTDLAREEKRGRYVEMLRAWAVAQGAAGEGDGFHQWLHKRQAEKPDDAWMNAVAEDCRAVLATRGAYDATVATLRTMLALVSRLAPHTFELARAR